jgi:enoyl-CoA hydratase/carnithine racemase
MNTSTAWIEADIQDAVATIWLARPEAGNRLSNAMAQALADALDAASARRRIVVLRARGEAFCLGRAMPAPPRFPEADAQQVLREDAAPIQALYAAFARCPLPVLGLVAGRAWGIGTVIAARCDLCLCSADSSFALRELERGIPPCIAMAPLLDRMTPKALAHLVFEAQPIDAESARLSGLVGRVVPRQQLEQEAQALMERMLSFPDAALRAVKQFISTAPRGQEDQAVRYGAALLAGVLGSR